MAITTTAFPCTDITKHLLQEANDRVEHMSHEVVGSADNLRGEIRAHPLLAVFTGIVVGGLLGRALR